MPRYAGELTQAQPPRNTIDLGVAEATVGASYILTGKPRPWRFSLPTRGDNSATQVFVADFDKNGHQDLLFINLVPGDIACGSRGGDVTILLLGDETHPPLAWQANLRLARNQDFPLFVTDRNGDGRAEIAAVACDGDTPTLQSILEVQTAGPAALPPRSWSGYAGDLRKHYRNKSIVVPKELAEPAPPATTTVDFVATAEWGNVGDQPVYQLGAQALRGLPKSAVATAAFRPIDPTGHDLTDLLDLLARATPVRAEGANLLRTYPDDAGPGHSPPSFAWAFPVSVLSR